MDIKLKQRVVGLLVVLALLAIFMPMIFYKMQAKSTLNLSSNIPSPPQLPDASTAVLGQWLQTLPENVFDDPGQWVVQLGTFSDSNNVESLITKLNNNAVPVFKQPIAVKDGRSLIRIFVGPLQSQQQAKQWQQQLYKRYQLNGIIKEAA